MKTLIAIVPAAGVGRRAAARDDLPKQYRLLAGEPMLRHAVRALLAEPRITQVLVAVSPGDERVASALAGLPRTCWRACGGPTRADTVRAALDQAGLHDADWVLVHDAARPNLQATDLARLVDACLLHQRGGLLAQPIADTVKQAVADAASDVIQVTHTLDRQRLWLAQTPQMFPAGLLRRALAASRGDPHITDESSAVERLAGQGAGPMLIPGSASNHKLTWPEDFERQEIMMTAFTPSQVPQAAPAHPVPFRVGQGYDVHALASDRPLIIGGVRIPHDLGLMGHSDADVLLHAVTDAVLGAAALGDIGRHFSDRDPRWKDADSRVFLREAVNMVKAQGWQVANMDATLHAEAPRMAPHVPAMIAVIAGLLDVPESCLSIKAKTNEGLGHLGRGEGIAASVVVLLARRPTA